MQDKKSVMVLGSGRLAHRIIKIFKERSVEVVHISPREFKEIEETEAQESSMDYAGELLIQKGINNVSAVCLVDSEDAVNIYLLMAVLAVREDASIYATFFNENLVSSLIFKHRSIKVFNPAVVVGKLFVEAIPDVLPEDNCIKNSSTYTDSPGDGLVWGLVAGFLWLIISGAWFFKLTESVDWQKSFYLVITVITSVNFNDAQVSNYDPTVQNLRMGLMIATYVYVLVALGFVIDWVIKRRTDVLMLGRRRYRNKGHVIVCGLGRVGYAIVQKLLDQKEDVIVIESDPNNKYLSAIRASKIPVLVGDATLSHYLIDAGIGKAKSLISAIDSDTDNLLIGLNARVQNNKIRILLRIFDQTTAEEMKKRLNIHYAFSKSFATAKVMCDWIFCRWQCSEINKARSC